MTRFAILLAAAIAALAQPVSFGLKGGANLTDPSSGVTPYFTRSQSPWVGGPSIELHLPKRFSIEFNALYRTHRSQTQYTSQFDRNTNPFLFVGAEKTRTWDFPLLLKYRILDGPVKPFVSAGAMLSRQSVTGFTLFNCLGPERSCNPPDGGADFFPRGGRIEYTSTRRRAVFGAGFEYKTRYFTIAPEVRFTGARGSTGSPVMGIVGFSFGRKK